MSTKRIIIVFLIITQQKCEDYFNSLEENIGLQNDSYFYYQEA